MTWTSEDARAQYNISGWGGGYVDVGAAGQLLVRPSGSADSSAVDLCALAGQVHDAGLTWPVLVRFTDILHTQVDRLCGAFEQAIAHHGADCRYTAVYPIKVNQQRHVVEAIVRHGGQRIGLEAGSKPELMAVLAIAAPGGTIICNGYKDAGYIRLALMGLQTGHHVTLVIEKLSELDTIIAVSRELGVRPQLGLRVRLSAATSGNWQNTGGDRSKFGFTAAGTVALLERIQKAGLADCIHLLHCHPGSQITDINVFKQALAEVAHTWRALRDAGLPLDCVDVGGGLGIDYEGTASDHLCSVNYDMPAYADAVVAMFTEICRQHDLPMPDLLTESGRALTAHHAVLITNVVDTERVITTPASSAAERCALLDELHACQSADAPFAECYARAGALLAALRAQYSRGEVTLAQLAEGETLYYALCRSLSQRPTDDMALLDEINRKLADKYFCNLSVFQSMPDVWGIDQVFPIVPLQRLDEMPDRHATLHDLTCDSDGHIEFYVDSMGVEQSLPVHSLRKGEDYLLGFFLLGAYQEILGDMHNLFGDTDAVNVELTGQGGYRLVEPRHGDTVDELLRYVEFTPARLLAAWRDKLAQADITPQQQQQYLQLFESGLSNTTYLENE
ncbi:MAG TPA: biosynthetic arginine decarboxylase [Gammaproteobacteria bacterium]|jgi:arginine decarboxylase|nr:biosynthetic arginine decarboxylase [Gammaproteobacteria bacterium]